MYHPQRDYFRADRLHSQWCPTHPWLNPPTSCKRPEPPVETRAEGGKRLIGYQRVARHNRLSRSMLRQRHNQPCYAGARNHVKTAVKPTTMGGR